MNVETSLPAHPDNVATARAWLRDLLHDHPDDLVDTVTLCVSEAVTNAILYSRSSLPRPNGKPGTVLLRVYDSPNGFLHVDVQDDGPRIPGQIPNVVAGSGLLAEHGRGMWLINSLTKHWMVCHRQNMTRLAMTFTPTGAPIL